jgi:hypothetical protein
MHLNCTGVVTLASRVVQTGLREALDGVLASAGVHAVDQHQLSLPPQPKTKKILEVASTPPGGLLSISSSLTP